MLRPAYITDCALVCGLGNGVETVWSQLLQGKSAIRPVQHFDCDNYITDLAATVADIPVKNGQSRLYPLLEQLLTQLDDIPADAQLLTATTKGAIDLLEQHCRNKQGHDGGLLAGVKLGTVTSWLAQRLRLTHGGTNINAACTSSTLAIGRAAAMIAHDRADVVVVCCADLVSEFVFSGFSALQALAVDASRPFDRERNGLTLGEGGAALVLMSAEAAQRYGRSCLARVCGWGAANDANHITAPARDGRGLIQTIRQTLSCADIAADAVAAISAHGTGTVYNDMMEITAFKEIFAERKVSFSSVKGAIGHTLGAAGGIEAVLALKSLETGLIPPTCGLKNPEQLAAGQLSNAAQSFDGDMLLSTNSGFGGVNAALLLQRVDNSVEGYHA